MSWEEQYEDEGREFEIDDSFVEVDTLIAKPKRRRAWLDETKDKPEGEFPAPSAVAAQRVRAYWKALPHSLKDGEWQRWRRAFGKCCAYCGDAPETVLIDHVVPIASGAGGTTIYNVLPACRPCNSKKRDMDPWRWFAIIGWEPFLERYAKALEAMNEKT